MRWRDISVSSLFKAKETRLRQSYTFEEKEKAVSLWYEATQSFGVSRGEAKRLVAKGTGVPYNTVRKWVADRVTIKAKAKDSPKRCREKRRSSWSLAQVDFENRVRKAIIDKRDKGIAVRFDYVRHIALRLCVCPESADLELQESYGSLVGRVKFTRSWFRCFLLRNGLSMRKKTNSKEKGIRDAVLHEIRFRSSLGQFLKNENVSDGDSIWGAYPPSCRFNFDQIPLPFLCEVGTRTVERRGSNRVWVRQPRPSLEKRQATLHLTIRAEGQQPKPILVFRGQGKRVSAWERSQWDPRVHVLFQNRAWVDRKVALSIARIYEMEEALNEENKNLLFCDNLDAHRNQAFVEMIQASGRNRLWFLPAGRTDIFQPIDAGAGREMKRQICRLLDEKVLHDKCFSDKWETGKLTAADMRISLTVLVAEAFSEMKAQKYPFFKLFKKTGCMLAR